MASVARNSSAGRLFHRIRSVREAPGFVFLLAVILALWIKQPHFANPTNLMAVAREAAVVGIMGVGMTMVILTSGIDVSAASVLAFSSAVACGMMVDGSSITLSVLAGLGVGILLGAGNALLITRLAIPPIIATLGSMGILRAAVTLYTGAKWIGPLPMSFNWVGKGLTPLLIILIIGIPAGLLLLRTRLGRYIYAIGGNEEAVRLSGVNVNRVKLAVYTLNGLMAASAGLILSSSMSSAQSNMAMGYELNAIAAVVIGGTSITGGRGSVFGTLVGSAIMAVLQNALILLDAPIYWHKIITGAIIFLAVIMDKLNPETAGAEAGVSAS